VKAAGPNGRTISGAMGLLIFTGNHYSRMYTASDQPRKAIEDQAKAAAAELPGGLGPLRRRLRYLRYIRKHPQPTADCREESAVS
jgi:hypothetical protein